MSVPDASSTLRTLWEYGRGLARWRVTLRFQPPPLQSVHAVLPHTAFRHRSPAGMRRRPVHVSGQAEDPEPTDPPIGVTGGPVSARRLFTQGINPDTGEPNPYADMFGPPPWLSEKD
jgi:hypothetical protein